MSDRPADGERIVVGIDGSPPSKAALRWAVKQAGLTGAVVEAIMAWEPPDAWYGLVPPTRGLDEYAASADEVLTEVINEAIGPDKPVEIQRRVTKGHPAAVLLNAARDAQLLVVGNRGHGGFAEVMLGSVGQYCTQHAPCPVVIVRGGRL